MDAALFFLCGLILWGWATERPDDDDDDTPLDWEWNDDV